MTKSCLAWLVLLVSIIGAAEVNLLKDADFEKSAAGFVTQKYWAGEVEHLSGPGVGRSSAGALQLRTSQKGKEHFGRIMVQATVPAVSFRKFRLSIWGKGQGKLHLGAIKYVPAVEGKPNYIYDLQENPADLSGDWQQFSYMLDFSRERVNRIAPVIELRGESALALLDDAVLEQVVDPGAALSFSHSHQILPLGSAVPELSCRYSQGNTVLFLEARFNQEPVKQLELPVAADGTAVIPADICRQTTAGRLELSASAGGLSSKLFLQFVPAQDFSAAAALSRQVVLPKAMHILYLGDSLSDFDRGFNYPDKVNFWLNHRNPGKASFHNAGVGGDFITRVYARLVGGKTHRPEMYAGIFAASADYIFIFLGQNDTKASSARNFTIPIVPPEAQEKLYRDTIAILREKSPARLVLISAASTMADLCRQNTEKRVASGKVANMFGMPQHIEAYNAILQKLARELDLDYIDIYTPMQKHPDKGSLFSPADGVHLSEAGHAFVAEHILKYLSGRK
ncbi:MAG: SGNH/GDSL hydrolase family protein [Oligosphaeraceae bacterium]|nr:SGNH/GDSL hydrolase family protein [Oligosphaeraceae bacterium]